MCSVCSVCECESVGLFDFGSPLHVVGARFHAEHLVDERLHVWPKADLLERVVEPTGRNAKVRVVRRHVVHSVVDAWQYDVYVLQDRYVAWQTEVCM